VFVPYLGVFLLLYLTYSFALPSPDQERGLASGTSPVGASGMETGPEEVLDLEAFYFSVAHRRWFFGTLALMSGTIGVSSAGSICTTVEPAMQRCCLERGGP